MEMDVWERIHQLKCQVGSESVGDKMYKIEKTKDGYILFKVGAFKEHHTHLLSIRMAKQIRYNVIHRLMPKTRNIRLLYSHIRIAEDTEYIEKIQQLIDTRRSKGKQVYFNRSQ